MGPAPAGSRPGGGDAGGTGHNARERATGERRATVAGTTAMAVAPAGPRPDGVPRRDAGDIWHTAATSTRDATRPNGGPREARGDRLPDWAQTRT